MTSEAAVLSRLISDIYDAALDPTLWTRALENSCTFVGGVSSTLFWHDAASERSAVLHLFNEDPHYTQLYFDRYMPLNPLFPVATFVDAGVVYGSDDLMPRDEFLKTRFYKEWARPQGIVDAVAVNLEKSPTSSSIFNIRRSEKHGPVDPDARRRMALIVPHYQRAVAIAGLFDQTRTEVAVLTETLDEVNAGVILVGAKGRIAFANAPARAMLDEGMLLRDKGGVLVAVVPEAQRTLRDTVARAERDAPTAAADGVSIPLSTSPHQRWFAHVLPLTSGDRRRAGSLHSAIAAIFIRKTSLSSPPPLEMLAKQFRLTASEIRVLDAIMKVSSVRAVAELLGLSQATVKTHLQNVFRKTGTSRQSDLVKLMAGFEPLQT